MKREREVRGKRENESERGAGEEKNIEAREKIEREKDKLGGGGRLTFSPRQ